jgi:hypothetical protein
MNIMHLGSSLPEARGDTHPPRPIKAVLCIQILGGLRR